jgi:hypothetical protein
LITFDVPSQFFSCTRLGFRADSVDRHIGGLEKPVNTTKSAVKEEDSATKMQRLAEEMRFRIREAMAQRNGSEAFLHWLETGGGKKA